MLEKIHHSKIVPLMERRIDGRPIVFSLEYCKRSSGEIIHIPAAVLTSVHSAGATINIKADGEDKVRKLRKCLITKINGMKVYF